MNEWELYKRIIDGEQRSPCTHWWRHTVYAAAKPENNGTWCVLCRERVK